jgi:hypothetical protein
VLVIGCRVDERSRWLTGAHPRIPVDVQLQCALSNSVEAQLSPSSHSPVSGRVGPPRLLVRGLQNSAKALLACTSWNVIRCSSGVCISPSPNRHVPFAHNQEQVPLVAYPTTAFLPTAPLWPTTTSDFSRYSRFPAT